MKKVLVSCTVALLIVLISLPAVSASDVPRTVSRQDKQTTGSGSSRVDMNAIARQYQPTPDSNYADRHWTTIVELKQYVDPSFRILKEAELKLDYSMPFVSRNALTRKTYGSTGVYFSRTTNAMNTQPQTFIFNNLNFHWQWEGTPGLNSYFYYWFEPQYPGQQPTTKIRTEVFTTQSTS